MSAAPAPQPPRHGHLPFDDTLPYSKGVMARTLAAVGIAPDQAYLLARELELDLARRGNPPVELEHVRAVAEATVGPEASQLVVTRLRRLGKLKAVAPVIILIGGSTGTGKSTMAGELAHRLEITRVTSTDFIRQTMRAFFAPAFMPTIHFSTFEAGAAVDEDLADRTLIGFADQCRHVSIGVEAVLRHALAEGWSMILEGVHLVPGLLPPSLAEAVLVHAVIELPDEQAHRRNFSSRDASTRSRRPREKYLAHLGEIRRIQDYTVARARREGCPVIENTTPEETARRLVDLVLERAERVADAPPAP